MTSPAEAATARFAQSRAVSSRIDDFLHRFAHEREALYRAWLRANVTYASPLLLDLVALEGLDLDEVIGAMKPPPGWPTLPAHSARHSMALKLAIHLGPRRDRAFHRATVRGGVRFRSPDDPGGAFGFWPARDAFCVRRDFEPCSLVVIGADARLRLPSGIPDTLLCAAPGRRLDEIVDHPLFIGRGYRVRRSHSEDANGGPALDFRCGLVTLPLSRSRE